MSENDSEAVRLVARIPLAEGEGTIDVTPACLLNGQDMLETLLAPGLPMSTLVDNVKDLLAKHDGEEVAARIAGTSTEGIATFINAWITTTSSMSPFIVKEKITDAVIAKEFFDLEIEEPVPDASEAEGDDAAAPSEGDGPRRIEVERHDMPKGMKMLSTRLDPDDPDAAMQALVQAISEAIDEAEAEAEAAEAAQAAQNAVSERSRQDAEAAYRREIEQEREARRHLPWWRRMLGI